MVVFYAWKFGADIFEAYSFCGFCYSYNLPLVTAKIIPAYSQFAVGSLFGSIDAAKSGLSVKLM
jgi:hypothetical protein